MRAAPISRSFAARHISWSSRPSRTPPISGPSQDGPGLRHGRDSAGVRPRHKARSADGGRRLDRWGHALSRRDDPRLPRGRPSAVSHRPGHPRQRGGRRRRTAGEHRSQVPLQPGFRQRLRHGAGADRPAARAHTGDPDGAGHRARKGAGVHRQSLCDAGHPSRISAGQANSLHRGGDDQLRRAAADGLVHLRSSPQGQFFRCWRWLPWSTSRRRPPMAG